MDPALWFTVCDNEGGRQEEPWRLTVRKNKQLASRIAAVLAVITLAGTSTFAESRPSNGTRSRDAGGGIVRRGGASTGAVARRGNNSANRSSERRATSERRTSSSERRATIDRRPARGSAQDRGQARRSDRSPAGTTSIDRNRNQTRNNDRNRTRTGNYESYRGRSHWSRNGSNDYGRYSRGRGHSYGNRQPYYHRGRVSRVLRHGGGYRVWIGGAPYPFFIPSSYYHRNRFRVGLLIGLGGFYNSLGYYDYYGGYNDSYRYRDHRGYSSGVLRGVVESVDYRRDTFVVRNDETGSFVTVVMRDRRRDVRPGDYVELSGDWTRTGVFQAYDVDLLDDDDRDR